MVRGSNIYKHLSFIKQKINLFIEFNAFSHKDPRNNKLFRKVHWISLFSLCSLLLSFYCQAENPKVSMSTDKGEIIIELYPEKAPKGVENFLEYVNSHFYDGLIFHRVVKDFVIQGGGFSFDLQKKPTREPIPLEADNGLQNLRGSLAYARTFDPNSATSQFYINLKDNHFLDHRPERPGYAVFGKVIKGMEFVDAISAVELKPVAQYTHLPADAVYIKKMTQLGKAEDKKVGKKEDKEKQENVEVDKKAETSKPNDEAKNN